MANNSPTGSGTIPLVPLLITESDQEFHRIRQALYQETKPVGIIEEMYVEEIADIIWQILRLKRCKVGVTNLAFHTASAEILDNLMRAGPDVARDWISQPELAKKVETGLAAYKLDGSVIIAQAIKNSSYQLELIENLLASLETRRDKALVRIAQYRSDLGAILRKVNHQLIESKVVDLPRSRRQKENATPPTGQRPGCRAWRRFQKERRTQRPEHGKRTPNRRQPPQRAKKHRPPLGSR